MHFNTSYLDFRRTTIKMAGPDTDQLTQSGIITTPYPQLINSSSCPMRDNSGKEHMAVLVPLQQADDAFAILQKYYLIRPTREQAIRFTSQFKPKDEEAEKETTIIFLHHLHFDLHRWSWLTYKWWPGRGLSVPEICLHKVHGRTYWPENTFFAGIAQELN